ncbi:MAG: ABC transporter permease [Candidatus ainarchaeum sp.]|nr:ABC transporter permease [Candidatus ainarchaeum sp.]
MYNLIKVAFLNIFRRKKRTALALLGIIVGIASLIILVSVVDGLYEESFATLGKMQGITVFSADALAPFASEMSMSYKMKLESVQGVKVAIPQILQIVGTIDNKKTVATGPQSSYSVIGLDPENYDELIYNTVKENLISGQLLKSSDKDYVLISTVLAEDYKKSIGSKIDLDGKEFKIKGIFKAETSTLEKQILISLDGARESYGIAMDKTNLFNVITVDPSESDAIAEKIEFKYEELKAVGQQERMKTVGSFLDYLRYLVIVVTLIAAIIAGLGVVNTMLMSVMERIKEIGTLKAVGWSKANIIYSVVFESAIIGIFGGILGIVIGIVGSALFEYFFAINTAVTFSLVIQCFLFAFVLGILGGIYPAIVASKMDPVEALRGN